MNENNYILFFSFSRFVFSASFNGFETGQNRTAVSVSHNLQEDIKKRY